MAFTEAIFSWLDQPASQAVTSTIAMTELLVQPYRDSDRHRVDAYYALLSTYPISNGSLRAWRSPIWRRGFALFIA